jgi:hypothetical protein
MKRAVKVDMLSGEITSNHHSGTAQAVMVVSSPEDDAHVGLTSTRLDGIAARRPSSRARIVFAGPSENHSGTAQAVMVVSSPEDAERVLNMKLTTEERAHLNNSFMLSFSDGPAKT